MITLKRLFIEISFQRTDWRVHDERKSSIDHEIFTYWDHTTRELSCIFLVKTKIFSGVKCQVNCQLLLGLVL